MASMLEPGIFLHPRPKKSVLPPPNKKRKIEHKIEEISFDNSARADYLTGFHKRKVQRAKRAQEEAEKKAKEERRVMRKQLREERKQELEEHVEAVNRAVRDAEKAFGDDVEEDNDTWGGIQDDEVLREIPMPAVDHEEEYIDEDRYTTVTVEAVDVTKDGLSKIIDGDPSEETMEQEVAPAKKEDDRKKWPKKDRKKKFRYESKAERKVTRGKQKAGNKAKADARRG